MKIKKAWRSVVAAMGMVIIMSTSANAAVSDSKLNDYRIRIHSTTGTTTIKANNGYEIYVDGVKNSYAIPSSGQDFTFSKDGNRIKMVASNGSTIASGSEFKIWKKDSQVRYFEVKGIDGVSYAKYPDNVVIRRSSNLNDILVINSTPMENYLKGVLPHEMGSGAPLEALKAQAVTARTLAVKRVGKNSADGFDVTNTTSDQVYKGYTEKDFSYSSNVYKAVEQTRGKVLLHGGRLLDGIFYSNNGGQTADDSFVWSSGVGNPYYTSKKDDFDTYLNKYVAGWAKLEYVETYSKAQLKAKIMESYSKYPAYFKAPYCTPSFNGIGDDLDIEVLNQVNGYVTQIRLSDKSGKSYILKNYANRWFFGLRSQQFNLLKHGNMYGLSQSKKSVMTSAYVKSSNGNVVSKNSAGMYVKGANGVKTIESDTYKFSGKGYGHGVGMSQNGAMNRADSGQNYEQILKFYYDGSTVGSNYAN